MPQHLEGSLFISIRLRLQFQFYITDGANSRKVMALTVTFTVNKNQIILVRLNFLVCLHFRSLFLFWIPTTNGNFQGFPMSYYLFLTLPDTGHTNNTILRDISCPEVQYSFTHRALITQVLARERRWNLSPKCSVYVLHFILHRLRWTKIMKQ